LPEGEAVAAVEGGETTAEGGEEAAQTEDETTDAGESGEEITLTENWKKI